MNLNYNHSMFIKNQNGFSIIQGLMLASLLAGTALVTSRLVTDQKRAASGARSKDAVDDVTELMYAALQYQDNCTQTIIANGAAATPLNGTRNINNIVVVTKNINDQLISTQSIFRTGEEYISNSVTIESMQVNYQAGNHSNLTPSTLEVRIGRNKADDSTKRTKDGLGGKDHLKKISLIIQRNNDGSFKSCYAVKLPDAYSADNGNQNLISQFCATLSPMFTWNSFTNTCNLNNNVCPPGQFFVGINSVGTISSVSNINYAFGGVSHLYYDYTPKTGISSIGSAHCRAPQAAFRLEELIDTNPTNCINRRGIRLIKVGGANKVRIDCI